LVPEYIKSFLASDLVSDAKKEVKMNDSMAARMFSPYANLVGTEYMSEAIQPLVTDYPSYVEETKHSILMEFVSRFLRHILSSLHKIPFPVWDICHYIFAVVGPKRGIHLVSSFLFARFFNPAIQNPEAYCQFDEEPSKKLRKFFSNITELITKLACTFDTDPLFTTEREVLHKAIDSWMTRPVSVPPPPQAPDTPFPWNIQEEAIRYLHRVLYDNLVPLSHKLGDVGVTNTLTYKLPEMLELLITPQLADDFANV